MSAVAMLGTNTDTWRDHRFAIAPDRVCKDYISVASGSTATSFWYDEWDGEDREQKKKLHDDRKKGRLIKEYNINYKDNPVVWDYYQNYTKFV